MKKTKTVWLVSGGILVSCIIALHQSLQDAETPTTQKPHFLVTDKGSNLEDSTKAVESEEQKATATTLLPSDGELSEHFKTLKDQIGTYEQIIASQDIYRRLNNKSLPESERMSLSQIVKDRDASVDKLIELSEEKLRRMNSMR